MTDAAGVTEGDDAGAWLSVGEAAKRLGMSERHVRRMTARLEGHDRTRTHGGPLRVRLDALERLRDEGPRQAERPGTDAPDMDTTPPVTGHGQRPDTDGAQQAVIRSVADAELIEQLRADLDFMKTALKTEQETSRALVGELTRANERAAVLIAATATGQIKQIEAQEPQAETETAAARDSGDTSGHDEAPRGFWARFLGKAKSQ